MGKVFTRKEFSNYLGEQRAILDVDTSYYEPSPTPSISPTPSPTPSISISPSITPSISLTPSISTTPTPSTTPAFVMKEYQFNVLNGVGFYKYRWVELSGVIQIYEGSSTPHTRTVCARSSPAPYFMNCNSGGTCTVTDLGTEC